MLNGRAAEWCEANGAAEAAVEYASAAGDLDRVARLVTQLAPAAHQAGRVVAVERWLRVLDAWPELDRHPDLCLGGAWIHGLRGRTPDAQRWADAAERGLPAADRRRALLRALRCADGVERMLADATVAAPGSRWEPKTLFTLGVALLLAGDEDAADATLARAVEAAAARGAADTQIATLSERSLIATARGAHADATAFVHEAESVPGAGRRRVDPRPRVGGVSARSAGARRPGARGRGAHACRPSASAADARRSVALRAGEPRARARAPRVRGGRRYANAAPGDRRSPARPPRPRDARRADSRVARPAPRARRAGRTLGVEPDIGRASPACRCS